MASIGQSGGAMVERQCSAQALESRPCLRISRPETPALIAAGKVEVVWSSQPYFVCGGCRNRFRALYADDAGTWRCRKCHGYDYSVRHLWNGVEYLTAARLRRRLGGEPGALSPLPPRPKTRAKARQYDLTVLRILELEARGLARTRHFNGALKRLAEDSP